MVWSFSGDLHFKPSFQAASEPFLSFILTGLAQPLLFTPHFHLRLLRYLQTSFQLNKLSDKHSHPLILSFPELLPTSRMSDRTIWGEKAHLDLLLSILNNVTISNSDWDTKILPELRAKGYTYTVSAALYALSTSFIRPRRL